MRARINIQIRSFNTKIAKVLEYNEFGQPSSVIQLKEREVRREKESDVLVKMRASPINPADVNMIQGVYGIKPSSFPAIGGNEGVGIIEESNSPNLSVGDFVIPSKPSFGTWRTYAVCEESQLTKIPNFISPLQASALSVNPSTAFRLLHDNKLKAGDVVIQNGANSMVGQSVVQIAKIMGISTINVVRSREAKELEELKERLKGMGASEVFTEDELMNFENKKILANYPKPSIAFNCVGGKSATDLARCLDDGGSMITYGGMSKLPVTLPTSLLIFKNITCKGFWLSQWLDNNPKEREEMLYQLAEWVRDNKLQFSLEEFRIEDYSSAFARFSQEKKNTKPVFSMP